MTERKRRAAAVGAKAKQTKSVGDRLAALNRLSSDSASPDSLELLRRALGDPSNHVVERAADLSGEARAKTLLGDLVSAYRRLMVDPLKRDPGCVGKTAVVRALVRLEHDDADLFREGIQYEQQEPVWGGRKDTAAELRGLCAAGLVACASYLEVLNRSAALLADRCTEARTGAAQAIAALGRPEGIPLLRLKLLTGDTEPDVMGECCAALLRLDREDGIALVRQFLSCGDADVCVQAALALGESRHPEAFKALHGAWKQHTDRAVQESLILCIGLLRSSAGSDFLFSLIGDRSPSAAADAVRALKVYGTDLRQQVKAAVDAAKSTRLLGVFREEWGPE